MSIAIKVENLSKAYQLGEIGTGTLSRDLERWFAKVRGKEDPFLKIGETNDRTSKGTSDIVWSLKDINFEIEQGDAVGIIGRNGAGKSTLLKILSRVTSPTTGKISGKGRIASLLEVGTGFHPELTGRENIFLNGAILGMRKKEIQRKFDEIVDFAGVERYVDTPVKRYSSGMYVRLAFAVAAHLDSEILIVDEVLAVGDAEFQKKCLGKMGEVSKGEGRTVLFVSHNMGSINELCDKAILLRNGNITSYDDCKTVIEAYLNYNLLNNIRVYSDEFLTIENFLINDSEKTDVDINDPINIKFLCSIKKDLEGTNLVLIITASTGQEIFRTYDIEFKPELFETRPKGETVNIFTIPPRLLNQGSYYISIILGKPKVGALSVFENILGFNIVSTAESYAMKSWKRGNGIIISQGIWKIELQ